MREVAFYKNDLRYGDLSRTIRAVILEQEFDSWSTWKDVDNSFSKHPRPPEGQSDYVFLVPLEVGMAYVYYDMELTGFKLRYVDVMP